MDEELVELSVLGDIVPAKKEMEYLNGVANRLLEKTRAYYAALGLDVEVRLAGSFAKGTHLSDQDFDIFMLFPPAMSREELERIGLKAGKDIIGGELVYSEHPYTTGYFEGIETDMVPCYHLESTEHVRTAVDRTPFHTLYINSHLNEDEKDQVRLLKRFMKGIGAYGAEQDSRGFSGYLCEVLVVKYKSFRNVLEASLGWEENTAIVIEEKGPAMESALVVYDPVDPKRNMASAVHADTLELFRTAAKAYLDDPSELFFFPRKRQPLDEGELEWICADKGTRLASVSFMRPESVNEDNLQAQLWRSQYALEKKFGEFDFEVLNAVHMMDDFRMYIVFELKEDVLSLTHKHAGPPARVASSEDFLNKWKGNPYGEPFLEDGRWMVTAERRIRKATDFLERQTSIAGIGKNIDPSTMTVYGHQETFMNIDARLLSELLDPKHPWEN